MVKFLLRGLWLSAPIGLISLIGMYSGEQSFELFIWISFIICLPWGIPGILTLAWAGLTHGLPEEQAMAGVWISAFWIFVSITINGALLNLFVSKVLKKSNQSLKEETPQSGAS